MLVKVEKVAQRNLHNDCKKWSGIGINASIWRGLGLSLLNGEIQEVEEGENRKLEEIIKSRSEEMKPLTMSLSCLSIRFFAIVLAEDVTREKST